ncbi:hypothetical protein [Maricaulis sp.]|uniref:hypothetical protein n=1 Tax=Maricaulis sp. TaxID=1486257 RepID=UPI0032989854
MTGVFREIGKVFGFGSPKVNEGLMAAERRAKINEQGKQTELEGEADAQRIRASSSGRRAALASQIRDTLG